MYKIIGGDQKEYGPASADEVRAWIAEGRLNGQSSLLADGASEWRPLGGFPEFTEALRAQAGASMPPPGAPMPPASAQLWKAQILSQQPQVRAGQCLALSWKLFMENSGLLFGGCFLVWMLGLVCGFLPFGGVLWLVLKGVLYGGLYLVFLDRIRGKPAAVGDVFTGFNVAFAQLALVGLVSGFLTGLGTACCLIIPGLYLFVAWTFSVPLVADRRMEFWSAMELSRKVTNRVWFEMFGLIVLAFLPTILAFLVVEVKVTISMVPTIRELMTTGAPDFSKLMALLYQIVKSNVWLLMVSKLVVLLNLPFGLGALMYAYENLFGARTAPAA